MISKGVTVQRAKPPKLSRAAGTWHGAEWGGVSLWEQSVNASPEVLHPDSAPMRVLPRRLGRPGLGLLLPGTAALPELPSAREFRRKRERFFRSKIDNVYTGCHSTEKALGSRAGQKLKKA